MENYKLIEKLGQGAQATNFLAENKETGQKCVLKKVECFDESQANKAFRESQDLLTLDHPYVSGYKEFFVMWEKENSSMYMTIVMDYFPNGQLGQEIEKCSLSGDSSAAPIPEEQIKLWLGQIIEALIYVHQKGIIHRDVKPSNLYLQGDGTLKLGDFAVKSVMDDATTCTRTTVEISNYMAPDVQDKGFTQQSDIWSVGCILLELATATLLNKEKRVQKLKEIKEDPYNLEDILEDVSKVYSKDLTSLIRCLMKTKNRPTALELKQKYKYVQACIAMTDATQLEKRRRQQSAKKSDGKVPKEKGQKEILKFLASNIDFEDLVLGAFEALLEIAKDNDNFTMDASGKRLVCMTMRNSLQNEQIQIKGCEILNKLLITDNVDDVIYGKDIISIFPRSMEEHEKSSDVQQAAASCLMAAASNGEATDVIGYLGGVHHLLAALKNFPNNPELCFMCCQALWSLSVNENNVKIATAEKGLELVCNALKNHMNSPEVAEAASACILAMSCQDENFDYVGDLDCVGLLISAVDTHVKSPKVVKNACLALASLVEPDEESAYKVLTNEAPGGGHIAGVPKIMAAYEMHKDNAEVVESVVTLLMELAEYDEICYDLVSFKIQNNLKEVMQKFIRNKDIMVPCEKALQQLQNLIKKKQAANAARNQEILA